MFVAIMSPRKNKKTLEVEAISIPILQIRK